MNNFVFRDRLLLVAGERMFIIHRDLNFKVLCGRDSAGGLQVKKMSKLGGMTCYELFCF